MRIVASLRQGGSCYNFVHWSEATYKSAPGAITPDMALSDTDNKCFHCKCFVEVLSVNSTVFVSFYG